MPETSDGEEHGDESPRGSGAHDSDNDNSLEYGSEVDKDDESEESDRGDEGDEEYMEADEGPHDRTKGKGKGVRSVAKVTAAANKTMGPVTMTPYERQRQANILKNQEMLRELGLDGIAVNLIGKSTAGPKVSTKARQTKSTNAREQAKNAGAGR
jgi:hypothetical protein